MYTSTAVVVPSVRPDNLKIFLEKWDKLFKKHDVELIIVEDGDSPTLKHMGSDNRRYSIKDVMGQDSHLIYNKNDGVRNLGFAFVAKFLPEAEYIITLDDDCYPVNDPIQDHIDALNTRQPVSWISTASEYMRGFPYEVREEAETVLSHGVWEGVCDYDAPTQLVNGNKDVTFYKGSIPKGIYFPMCIMNVAFKRQLLPYMYQAPMGYKIGLDRFADIWSGINVKREIDKRGWSVVTGYSTIYHSRASNVFTNLVKESRGIGINETYWKGDESDPYFKIYNDKRKRWQEFISKFI